MNKVTCEHLSPSNVPTYGNLSTIPTTVSILKRENISITERRSKTPISVFITQTDQVLLGKVTRHLKGTKDRQKNIMSYNNTSCRW